LRIKKYEKIPRVEKQKIFLIKNGILNHTKYFFPNRISLRIQISIQPSPVASAAHEAHRK